MPSSSWDREDEEHKLGVGGIEDMRGVNEPPGAKTDDCIGATADEEDVTGQTLRGDRTTVKWYSVNQY